jgi:hypothetical protein
MRVQEIKKARKGRVGVMMARRGVQGWSIPHVPTLRTGNKAGNEMEVSRHHTSGSGANKEQFGLGNSAADLSDIMRTLARASANEGRFVTPITPAGSAIDERDIRGGQGRVQRVQGKKIRLKDQR